MMRQLLLLPCLCVCTSFLVLVCGFVPPRRRHHQSNNNIDDDDNDDDFESVHAMRWRLGLTYNYTPDLLNPEMCRYLSEEECRDANDSLQAHARKMRKLPEIARQKQRQLKQQQQPITGDEQEERELYPSVGVVKVLVLLLQFPDHRNRTLIDPKVYDEMWNSKSKSDLIPSGSVSRWFQLNSYGLYEIEAHIMPWTVSDNTELYYSYGSSGLVTDLQQSFWPALDKLDQAGMDWSKYDIDGDGTLDAVVALHTGYAAELKGVDCQTKRDFSSRIWSHAFASSMNSWMSADGRYQVGGYVFASAYRDVCGSEPATIGTMTHEFLHTLGLVDLYDGQDAKVGRGIGGFDIMATPYGPKDDPSWPGHLSGWSRILVGWLMPIEIVSDGEYSVQASELSNQAYVIRKPYPIMEYLLIENRQPLWYDARLWTGGLVIYHIDDRASLQMARGYPGQEGWPRNGNHYQVAVLASDGQYNLEKGDNVGDIGDFWKQGMTLGPGNGRVFPNTDSYQFGSIRVTGITIDDIKKVDTVMTFRVTGLSESTDPALQQPLGTPAPTSVPTTIVVESPTIVTDGEETIPPVPHFFDEVDGIDDSLTVNATPADDDEGIGANVDMEVSKAAGGGDNSAASHLSYIGPILTATGMWIAWGRIPY